VKIRDLFRKPLRRRGQGVPTTVVFAGGMGTQIIQAAVYFSLKKAGEPVVADLSYFDTESRMAKPGTIGTATHWFWQLDQYGLKRESFDCLCSDQKEGRYVLADGAEMMELGVEALQCPKIQQRFHLIETSFVDPSFVPAQPYLCIHVRRGDYLNVASHLIADEDFIQTARKFSSLVDNVVILSDSPFEDGFRVHMEEMFKSVHLLDKLDPYTSHWLMRQARILVCSNSTYSLTAALLNPAALVVMPKQWFGANDQAIERPIHALCKFQVMH
jgi:Glycosyl transferase family 11